MRVTLILNRRAGVMWNCLAACSIALFCSAASTTPTGWRRSLPIMSTRQRGIAFPLTRRPCHVSGTPGFFFQFGRLSVRRRHQLRDPVISTIPCHTRNARIICKVVLLEFADRSNAGITEVKMPSLKGYRLSAGSAVWAECARAGQPRNMRSNHHYLGGAVPFTLAHFENR